jgi:cytochrome c oxidase subunit 4
MADRAPASNFPDADARRFARAARAIAAAWLALVVLMLLSLGSAYLRLGNFNVVAGLVIATIKSALVAWLFMRVLDAGTLIRLAALAGLGLWAIQLGLTGVDYGTRTLTPAPIERPLQSVSGPLAASEPAAR